MEVNKTPLLDKNKAETGCCPRFDREAWDEQEFVFKDKPFVKGITRSFMHVPLNMGSMMKKTWKLIEDAGADSYEFVMLSKDTSPWRAEHYLSVSKDVPGADNVKLSGTYLARVFEGPYQNVGKWYKTMKDYASGKGKEVKDIYFYYTTCPKCAKHYGENYVVGFAEFS